jgi:hypothetical protein
LSDADFDDLFTKDKPFEHTRTIDQHGLDLPEIRNCIWGATAPADGLGG